MDSNSRSSDRLSLRSSLLRPFRALCGRRRRSFSDLSPLDQEGTTTTCSFSKDSNTIHRYRYDVFISFRGPDTRNTFVGHLYTYLTRKGIFAFKDDIELQKGESISPQLLQAIKDSRISIIVFSKDYAASTWCLDEMSTIAECSRKLKQTVFPIFYDVDPSHVRKQIEDYASAFEFHAERFDQVKLFQWKSDMSFLAGKAGWDVRNRPEYEEIENIVQEVIKKLGHKFSGFADDLIGMQPHVEALENHLELGSKEDGFRVLGIWGMSGIGKTTLATALYDKISYQFDACCFIENISVIYKAGSEAGAIAVEKQILHQTIKEKSLDTYSASEISGIVRNRLQNIKLLVVLDDVDQHVQLEKLNLKPKLLCTGSRIIITTTDEHILNVYGADKVYRAQLMNDNDARVLLCRKAFKSDYSSSTFAELIPEVLKYSQGLPLAIRVMGCLLCTRNDVQWRAILNRLQNDLDKSIEKVLQTSFEGLGRMEKDIFLHVACFFTGDREDYVMRILDACELCPDIGIPRITEKSLITIRNQEIHMHRMLQVVAKRIVKDANELGMWSRLWLYKDFHHVMSTETKPIEVKAIVLEQKDEGLKLNALRVEDFSKMRHLELLILYQKNFSGRPIFFSNSLRFFSWNGYPFTSLPSDFQPCKLIEFNMPDSDIEQLWEDIQYLPCLKRMDLSNSKNLKMTPSFERMQNLERLDFTGCINLLEVHPSIGVLTGLVFLSLQNCSSLVSLDFGRGSGLCSLMVLRLSGCTKLENTPDITGALNLKYLDMDQCTSLSTIHESIGALAKLRFLSLRDCTNLVRMPDSFNNMISLTTLDLRSCSKFRNLPLYMSHHLYCLIFLDLSFCNISEISDAIGELRFLERLNLQGNNFVTIPSTIKMLSSLSYLNLSHCHSLEYLPMLPTQSAPSDSDSVGRYFNTTSGSRDHRSGLYLFDCQKMAVFVSLFFQAHEWINKLVKDPRHFRCGFDLVLPSNELPVPIWLDSDQRFNGGSIIRIKNFDMHVDWTGFAFYVSFVVKNHLAPSNSPLPYPFYLSFESEHTEECFDMPLSLERNMVDGSSYLWIIYISREHCHFVKTGAQITFKSHQGLMMKEWGLRVQTIEDMVTEDINAGVKGSKWRPMTDFIVQVGKVKESSSSSSIEPKIQLPYNWLVSDEDGVENGETKEKEINLFNLGL